MFKNRESIDEFIALNGIKVFLDLMILDGQIKTYEYKGLKEKEMPTKHIMTRAEAIKLFAEHMATPSSTSAERIIDFYVAAGMLEIKEEKETLSNLIHQKYDLPQSVIDITIFAINELGYKITENNN